MTSVKRKLYGLTVGELKELLKEVDNKTEIAVWAEIPLQKAELEIVKYDNDEIDVDINIE